MSTVETPFARQLTTHLANGMEWDKAFGAAARDIGLTSKMIADHYRAGGTPLTITNDKGYLYAWAITEGYLIGRTDKGIRWGA